MDTENNCFCIAPWIHLNVWPTNEVYPCCMTYPHSYGSLNDKTLKEIWNSDEIKQLRLRMLNGIPSESCKECYQWEKVNKISPRQTLNENYKHHIKYVKETKDDGTFERFNLVYWDFRFNNLCNFKCRSCDPDFSTGWYKDHNELIDELDRRNVLYKEPKVVNRLIFSELESLYDSVEEIYFVGGEPLIMPEHYWILKRLIDLKKYDVKLMYNTNFSILKYRDNDVLNYWKDFKNIDVHASIDGCGQKGELIRKGFNWNNFLTNVKNLRSKAPHVNLHIDCTYQALNSFHIIDLHKVLYEEGIIKKLDDMYINFLITPEYLSLNILDTYTKNKLCDKISDHIQNYLIPNNAQRIIEDFESCIEFIQNGNREDLIPEFIKFTNALDYIRNENTRKLFPELEYIWNYD